MMDFDELHLIGKRKKKVNPCPNPLFVQWLTEWREEAAEKGWKSQYTYGKALKTLKKYPLAIATGKECKILENFGDKTCKMLDDKLALHIQKYGSIVPAISSDAGQMLVSRHGAGDNKTKPATKRKRGTAKETPTATQTLPLLPSLDGPGVAIGNDNISIQSVSIEEEQAADSSVTPSKRRRRHSTGRKEYVPTYRSGPYALLLALYRNIQNAQSSGFLSKTQLIHEAQPLADASFTITDPGSQYTAWSSMGAIIKKGYIIKEGNPAKYSITTAGCELAHRLETVTVDQTNNFSPTAHISVHDLTISPLSTTSSPADPFSPLSPAFASLVSSRDVPSPALPDLRQTGVATTRPGLHYWYVTESGETALNKDRAAVTVDDEISVGFLIKCAYSELLTSGKRYKLDMSRALGDTHVHAYIHDGDADEFANPPISPLSAATPSTVTTDSQPVTKNSAASAKPVAKQRSKQTSSVNDGLAVSLTSLSEKIKATSATVTSRHYPAIIPNPATTAASETTTVVWEVDHSSCKSATSSTAPSSHTGSSGIVSETARTQAKPDCKPLFVMRPGTFEVVLCVDNREFYGGGSMGGKQLLPGLMKNGVNSDLRVLQVGDFVWVAREKGTRPQQTATTSSDDTSRELVLDYIIERKRMDDLVSSCIDGRMKEQKFRLKHCGLRRPIYLIEEYGSAQHFSISESRLRQMITNLQVIDDFSVKRCRDTKESAAYLTLMTRYLNSHFQTKTLYGYSSEHLQALDSVYNINNQEHCLMTFTEFNQATTKTKPLTIQEMFSKQLVQLYRTSGDSVKAIVDVYPTPTHLLEAYDQRTTDKEKENLLSSIKLVKSGRQLGNSLSRQVYQLYCTTGTLT